MAPVQLRTGIDLIEVDRIRETLERYGDHFCERVFTPQELAEAGGRISSLAARFAAKEAASKALGTGIGIVCWKDIEILYGPDNKPIVHLHGEAARLSSEQRLHTWSVSLSHTRLYAVAVVVAIGE
ncbi:MAG: holo-[acyl-carrier-protein] synthase [Chloroflexota bacterium]|nr:MAG: holo-[acyl-carrier-protein] synthase [Chloroflexota bacterium]